MSDFDPERLSELAKAATPAWQASRFVDNRRYAHMSKQWKAERDAEERLILRGPGPVGSPQCNPIARFERPEDVALAVYLHQHIDTILALASRTPQTVPEDMKELVNRLHNAARKLAAYVDVAGVSPSALMQETAAALLAYAARNEELERELEQCASWLTYLTRGLGSVTSDKVKAWLAARRAGDKPT